MTIAFLVAAAAIAPVHHSDLSHGRLAGWEFVAESVSVDVSESSFTVRGEYQFRVSAEATTLGFRYPFPREDSVGAPELLEAWISSPTGWKVLDVTFWEDGWRWIAGPDGSNQCAIKIAYRQTTTNGQAHYVLTSTREWGRALDHARFEIRVPARGRYRIVPSLPLAQVTDGQQVYRGEFVGFLPTADLLVDPLGD